MPALMPIILASAHLVLAADHVPQFNIEPTCHAIHRNAPALKADEEGCKRDERAAHDKLEQNWSSFTGAQRDHCTRLSTLGGFPSYVELLTCLELGKATKNLPANQQGQHEATGRTTADSDGKAGRLIKP
jgi:hypothetical protein